MRPLLLLISGLLELTCAIVLVLLAFQLPNATDVDTASQRIETVGRNASQQVRLLRDECTQLRLRQPELLRFAQRLEKQMRQVDVNLRGQSLDHDTLHNVSEALGDLAKALDSVATTLDPKGLVNLGKSLSTTAALLDKDAGKAMRHAEKSITEASERWPETRASLAKSAELLRATRKQLQDALTNRHEFEELLQQTMILTTTFAESLPVLIQQLEVGLTRQEVSLDELGRSIDQVTEAVPQAARSATSLLVTVRVLLGLVAVLVALHAGYVLVGVRRGSA